MVAVGAAAGVAAVIALPAVINGYTNNAIPLKSWFLRRYHDYRWYNQKFSYKQNEDACNSILKFIAANQKSFGAYYSGPCGPCVTINIGENKYQILIPRLNKLFGFDTKYGVFYIKIISNDTINIHGFELAVKRRRYCLFIDYDNMNFLNCIIVKILKKSNIIPSDYYDTLYKPHTKPYANLPVDLIDEELHLLDEINVKYS